MFLILCIPLYFLRKEGTVIKLKDKFYYYLHKKIKSREYADSKRFLPFSLKTLSKVFPFEKRGCRYGAQKTENVTYYVDPFFHKGMHAIFCRPELEWKRQRKLAGTWQAFGG